MMRSLSPFGNGPDDQGLSASLIAGGKNTRYVGLVIGNRGFDIRAGVEFKAQLVGDAHFRAGKTQCKQGQVAGPFLLGALEFHELGPLAGDFFPFHLHGDQAGQFPIPVAFEFFGGYAEIALCPFLVGRARAEPHGPEWPRLVFRPAGWRLVGLRRAIGWLAGSWIGNPFLGLKLRFHEMMMKKIMMSSSIMMTMTMKPLT